jgi:hypothetical protein
MLRRGFAPEPSTVGSARKSPGQQRATLNQDTAMNAKGNQNTSPRSGDGPHQDNLPAGGDNPGQQQQKRPQNYPQQQQTQRRSNNPGSAQPGRTDERSVPRQNIPASKPQEQEESQGDDN